jgi:hypothetical protein
LHVNVLADEGREEKRGVQVVGGPGFPQARWLGPRILAFREIFRGAWHRGQLEKIAGGELKRIATGDHRVAILELDEAAIHRAAREDEAELAFPAVPVPTRPIFFVTIWFKSIPHGIAYRLENWDS